MKLSAHSVHPDVVAAVKALDAALDATYHSKDFAYAVHVEGQIVASVGMKNDTEPDQWPAEEVEAEVAKRAKKPEKVAGEEPEQPQD